MGNPRDNAAEILREVNPDLIAKFEVAIDAIRAEAIRAARKFKPFNSAHEGFAVLKEEVDELWDEVKGNDSLRASEEAVQVGAMAVRFLTDVPVKTNTAPPAPPQTPVPPSPFVATDEGGGP